MPPKSFPVHRGALWGAAALAVLFSPVRAAFEFKDGDRICVVGNALADRLQSDGWVETVLQSALPGRELVFRNLGFPGDQVEKRPRSQGFPSAEDYLQLCEADVIFAFFGYNESFEGESGAAGFQAQLEKMIDAYRQLKPNGESEPRIVLFSPIAHEDLETTNLPDGVESNARLAIYRDAMKAAATAKDVAFIDLFEASAALYAASPAALTINGIHLTTEGNRQLAEVIARELLERDVEAAPELEPLREAVLDKNWHWFNRYRALDGNDVWGSRADLKFTDNQTNREVLQHELVMLDVMAANRDMRIHALARGSHHTVDDSNVPRPQPVKTNVGGGSPSSSADKEGALQYLSGEEGIDKMKVPDGYEVGLFADEQMFPELVNPVQMAVDPAGRLWVAAWKSYPKWEPLTEMNDRILILPDENRDGVADRAITFAKVHSPTALEFWNGGVLVASQPDILFLKDTDGDDVADVRVRILHGIGSADTHHAANAFVYGPDGAIYWQSGIFLQNSIEHPWGPPMVTGASGMYRFDPRRFTISFHASNSPNPHGISFDGWGYHYANDGTSGNAFQVVPEKSGFRMRELLKKEVRPVPANAVVSSANFPPESQQNFLIANTIGFLGIKQYQLERNPETGDVRGDPVADLLVSSDPNFRPSDLEFGPDGALYVSDWHNIIIGHMQHHVRDPNRDHQHGRIYRVTFKDRPLQDPVAIAGAPIPQLLRNLEHPVDGVRYRTRIELSGRDSDEVIAACREWIEQFDPANADDGHHLTEALWLHQQHNRRAPELLAGLLQSPEPHARIAAQTVQHHLYSVDFAGAAATLARDEGGAAPGEAKPSGVISDDPQGTEVRISAVVERMRYDVTSFTVKAGNTIRVTFANPDFMPHNLVFVQPNAADAVAMEALKLGAEGFARGFVPESDQILAASKLLDHGAEETFEFTAPTEAGTYQFVCTFPGHHLLMRGEMKVE